MEQRKANSQNSVLNHSAEQKTLGIPFEPFPRGEICSEFHSMEKEIEANSRNSGPKHVSDKTCCLFCLLEIDSAVNLGMPWNVHCLPRNSGSHSESIPQNFFGTKFRCKLYLCSKKKNRHCLYAKIPHTEID